MANLKGCSIQNRRWSNNNQQEKKKIEEKEKEREIKKNDLERDGREKFYHIEKNSPVWMTNLNHLWSVDINVFRNYDPYKISFF